MYRLKAAFAAAMLLTMTSITARAADLVHVPATAQARVNAEVLSRAERALHDFVIACSLHDGQGVARAVTDDAIFEYALGEPGAYLTYDAPALLAHCSGNPHTADSAVRISNLWIFPTNDSNAVFVRYSTDAAGDLQSDPATSCEHLVLIEMRGDLIRKLREFTGVGSIATAATR